MSAQVTYEFPVRCAGAGVNQEIMIPVSADIFGVGFRKKECDIVVYYNCFADERRRRHSVIFVVVSNDEVFSAPPGYGYIPIGSVRDGGDKAWHVYQQANVSDL